MQNIYDRKRELVDKVGKQLIDFLNKKYLIFYKDTVVFSVKQHGFKKDLFGLCINEYYILYEHNADADNGYYNTITDLRKKFKESFKIINPKNIEKLIL